MNRRFFILFKNQFDKQISKSTKVSEGTLSVIKNANESNEHHLSVIQAAILVWEDLMSATYYRDFRRFVVLLVNFDRTE